MTKGDQSEVSWCHLVDLGQLLVDALLGVEVPDVQPHAVLLHAVHVSAKMLS